jgi:hypothetical protein
MIHVTAARDTFNVSFVEPDQTSWCSGELGRVVNRTEALGHPWKAEVLALTDHMIENDQISGGLLGIFIVGTALPDQLHHESEEIGHLRDR